MCSGFIRVKALSMSWGILIRPCVKKFAVRVFSLVIKHFCKNLKLYWVMTLVEKKLWTPGCTNRYMPRTSHTLMCFDNWIPLSLKCAVGPSGRWINSKASDISVKKNDLGRIYSEGRMQNSYTAMRLIFLKAKSLTTLQKWHNCKFRFVNKERTFGGGECGVLSRGGQERFNFLYQIFTCLAI